MKNACDIIILAMNNYRFTKACLENLFACDAGFPFSVHLLDNASDDGTPDKVARGFRNVKIWRSDRNLGFAAGSNIVLAGTSSRFACLLNNDTIVTTGWLGEMVAAAESGQQVGVVGCRGNNADDKRPDQAVECEHMNLENLDHDRLQRIVASMSHAQPRFKQVNMIVGFCMLLRRSMLNRIGALDTRFWPGNFEDKDICLRAVEAGYKVMLANRSFVYHFVSSTFCRDKKAWRRAFSVNRRRFEAKWAGRRSLIGKNARRRLRLAVELPYGAELEKVVMICEELIARGYLVHTFGESGTVPVPNSSVPHVASAVPAMRYADCDIVLHRIDPPQDASGARVHARLVIGRCPAGPPKCAYRLHLGGSSGVRVAAGTTSVRWWGRATGEAGLRFHRMVDKIEEYLRGIQEKCGKKRS